MNRYTRYKRRLFWKRCKEIRDILRQDDNLPSSLSKCFKKLDFNPDHALVEMLIMLQQGSMDRDAWHDLSWILISIGYMLGRTSAKKRLKKNSQSHIFRFPRLK